MFGLVPRLVIDARAISGLSLICICIVFNGLIVVK